MSTVLTTFLITIGKYMYSVRLLSIGKLLLFRDIPDLIAPWGPESLYLGIDGRGTRLAETSRFFRYLRRAAGGRAVSALLASRSQRGAVEGQGLPTGS